MMRHNVLVRRRFFDEANKEVGLFGWALTTAITLLIAILQTAQAFEFADIAERALRGVVNIQTNSIIKQYYGNPYDELLTDFFGLPKRRPGNIKQFKQQNALGSGFLISSDGYIVTNYHVIEHADEIVIILAGSKQELLAKRVGADKKSDLALLKIDAPGRLFPLRFGNSQLARIGEEVLAIGNPFGLSHTVTKGIISAKNRAIGKGPLNRFIQTDASINFGNSGGPLIDKHGRVIGVNTAINNKGTGLGFAIPSNMAKRIIDDLITHRKVIRSFIGVTAEKINYSYRKFHRLRNQTGIIITNMLESSPGDRYGLEIADIIFAADEQPIEKEEDLESIIDKKKPGQFLILKVLRRKGFKTLRIQLAAFPTNLPGGYDFL